jgi:homoaconitase/3-isopropylmalate dehydratase large subunit
MNMPGGASGRRGSVPARGPGLGPTDVTQAGGTVTVTVTVTAAVTVTVAGSRRPGANSETFIIFKLEASLRAGTAEPGDVSCDFFFPSLFFVYSSRKQ